MKYGPLEVQTPFSGSTHDLFGVKCLAWSSKKMIFSGKCLKRLQMGPELAPMHSACKMMPIHGDVVLFRAVFGKSVFDHFGAFDFRANWASGLFSSAHQRTEGGAPIVACRATKSAKELSRQAKPSKYGPSGRPNAVLWFAPEPMAVREEKSVMEL